MKYKTKFELEDEPGVPEHLRWAIGRAIPYARHCSVVELAQGSRTRKQANAFKLTLPQGGSRPKESLDDIAQAVCNIMQYRWEELAIKAGPDEMGPVKFRVEFQAPDSPKTQRPYCDWVWDPSEILSDNDEEMRNVETTVLRDLLDTQAHMIDRQNMQSENMCERFLKLAELNAEPIKQTGEQLNFANSLSLQGMQALVGAAQLTYSHEAQEALEKQRTERWKMVADKVGPGLSLAFGQLTAFVGSKLTGQKVTIPRGGVPDGPNGRPPAGSNGAAHPPPPPQYAYAPGREYQGPAANDDEEEQEEITEPIATIAECFGESLTAGQRKTMRKDLEPDHLDIFDDLFCSEDDEEAIAHYERLVEEIPAPSLIKLAVLLDPDQRAVYAKFSAMAKKAIDDRDAQPDEDD